MSTTSHRPRARSLLRAQPRSRAVVAPPLAARPGDPAVTLTRSELIAVAGMLRRVPDVAQGERDVHSALVARGEAEVQATVDAIVAGAIGVAQAALMRGGR